MNRSIVILINPYCHEGKGWKRWTAIRNEVLQTLGYPATEIVLENGFLLQDALHTLPGSGESIILSAGGDGSIHYLVNYLLTLPKEQIHKLLLGAIGLGSSNDFLKPFSDKILGIPVRMNINGPVLRHDIGVVDYVNDTGDLNRKYFIVNASFGVTAEANWKFNHPGVVLKWLKRTSTASAILYTAISTIVHHQNTECTIKFNQRKIDTAISNINVLKIPYVSGSFYYKQPIQRDDGLLSVNICSQMSRREMIASMNKLQEGSFTGSAKKQTAFSTSFQLTSSRPVVFECDGETELASSVNISVQPRILHVLNS